MTSPRHTPGSWIGSAWSCTVRLVVEDERRLTAATADLIALLERVDAAASRFRTDSALSKANARAGTPTPIPALLVDLVRAALDAAADTDGAVDPTLGLAMQRIGYDRDIAALRAGDIAALPAGDIAALPAGDIAALGFHGDRAASPSPSPGATDLPTAPRASHPDARWRAVRLHREAGLLTVPRGCALDLGATAKAWTADHAARTLANRYGTGVLVELGGDLAVAGHRDGGWCIRVAEREGADGQLVDVTRGGLATSTTTVRTWTRDGRPMHHIVDPATGRPAAGRWRTATVWAESALAANVATTAAIVAGSGALEWLTRRGLAARLVDRHGAVVTTPSWPAVGPDDRNRRTTAATATTATAAAADVSGARA